MTLIHEPLAKLDNGNSKLISNAVEHFINALSTILPLPSFLLENMLQIISVQQLPKGAILLAERQVSDKLFFIHKGLARSFYFEEGQEFTSRIGAENDFVYSPFSFAYQKASFETIQLLENSTLICIHKTDIDELHLKFPQAAYLSFKITERYLLLFDARIRALRLSAEERLLHFQKQYPHLVLRLQITHLASYLGISRSCLSHLRTKR
jgi:CRP-like cAMP-binding protein